MRTYLVKWSRSATRDLDRIVEYLYARNPDAGLQLFRNIREKCGALDHFPEKGRMVPEMHAIGITTYRELIFKNWRVIYRIHDHAILVLACLDTRRDLEDLIFDRLLD